MGRFALDQRSNKIPHSGRGAGAKGAVCPNYNWCSKGGACALVFLWRFITGLGKCNAGKWGSSPELIQSKMALSGRKYFLGEKWAKSPIWILILEDQIYALSSADHLLAVELFLAEIQRAGTSLLSVVIKLAENGYHFTYVVGTLTTKFHQTLKKREG